MLEQRIVDACDQLVRYGRPFYEEIVEIVEILSDINDDLWHSRLSSLTDANVYKIKILLDTIIANENKEYFEVNQDVL